MNLANRITLARILLVPVVCVILLVPFHIGSVTFHGQTTTANEVLAALVFIAAAATDALDGRIARKRKMITNFGKFLDPLADKLLVSAVLIILVQMQRMPAWVAIVIISREFAVTGLRLIAAGDGVVVAASQWGKWKTTAQMVGIVLLMLNNFPFSVINVPIAQIMIYVMVIMTVVSAIDYFLKNREMILSRAS
ncbi:CDP-diacylglycerol--glycerol-3-phosphate 3-phosphatidyltransferase [Alicyclobacillus acidocaldarius]|uniref:CDP-diacylglycerol--glycerol-3-phosphate 3-phosphatidyltransferase n=1 Tax=Alicyclobacillus acidocaldarius subsp. acidocaldarius (strain ATCC 27009 / DSM 446 / BCRC 14685 / JCM 5260 / KCTC 1825 / NBRC 15652 / NCIMB 11725 / NRRL B-14509 / 104-IA) TaxID=521098 RepID=C8WWM4_ALIAD|nr:CDP-diacylglycerol--glycerol-3-phosphate 3-phosphatidyltransferase [Alicyclobacillus acidocaldarius]ACV58495.1 CDP-diacylglycerol/glycerol-3-phosphate3-phospha tidyltransferase [Alicyclobacillus acidocaldarius subsp. acidocaldarius DSM 446]